MAEALRVLKPGGLCVISIPNGYRQLISGGESIVIRGLKEPGGTDFVDPIRPYDVLHEYVSHLTALGFEGIGVRSRLTDIYVSCIKPGGSYAISPRIPEASSAVASPVDA
jgi:hypothetical protein